MVTPDPRPGPIITLGLIAVVLLLIWGKGRQAGSGPDRRAPRVYPARFITIDARGPRWTA
jgi:hypothetical protein